MRSAIANAPKSTRLVVADASQRMVCGDMKKTNLQRVLAALERNRNMVAVPPEMRQPALDALNKMLELV